MVRVARKWVTNMPVRVRTADVFSRSREFEPGKYATTYYLRPKAKLPILQSRRLGFIHPYMSADQLSPDRNYPTVEIYVEPEAFRKTDRADLQASPAKAWDIFVEDRGLSVFTNLRQVEDPGLFGLGYKDHKILTLNEIINRSGVRLPNSRLINVNFAELGHDSQVYLFYRACLERDYTLSHAMLSELSLSGRVDLFKKFVRIEGAVDLDPSGLEFVLSRVARRSYWLLYRTLEDEPAVSEESPLNTLLETLTDFQLGKLIAEARRKKTLRALARAVLNVAPEQVERMESVLRLDTAVTPLETLAEGGVVRYR